jgi:hypothetical protein
VGRTRVHMDGLFVAIRVGLSRRLGRLVLFAFISGRLCRMSMDYICIFGEESDMGEKRMWGVSIDIWSCAADCEFSMLLLIYLLFFRHGHIVSASPRRMQMI